MRRSAISSLSATLLASGLLSPGPVSADQGQASFAVAVTLHAASKLPALEKLCPAARPMDLLGVVIRIDCPARTTASATKTASNSPTQPRLERPAEITVTY